MNTKDNLDIDHWKDKDEKWRKDLAKCTTDKVLMMLERARYLARFFELLGNPGKAKTRQIFFVVFRMPVQEAEAWRRIGGQYFKLFEVADRLPADVDILAYLSILPDRVFYWAIRDGLINPYMTLTDALRLTDWHYDQEA